MSIRHHSAQSGLQEQPRVDDAAQGARASAANPTDNLFDQRFIPDEIRLSGGRDRLTLAYSDAETIELAAPVLRAACRCAWCTRARIDGRFAPVADGITALEPMGDYALRLTFSDGHDRGIFPFAFLVSLAEQQSASHPRRIADAPVPAGRSAAGTAAYA